MAIRRSDSHVPSIGPPLLTPRVKRFRDRTRDPDHHVGLIRPKAQQWERVCERAWKKGSGTRYGRDVVVRLTHGSLEWGIDGPSDVPSQPDPLCRE